MYLRWSGGAPGRIRTCPDAAHGKRPSLEIYCSSSSFENVGYGQQVSVSDILGSVKAQLGRGAGRQDMTTKQRRRARRSWGKLRRERSGRWSASYVGPDLARHTAGVAFTSKMDAGHWLAGERRLIERDTWTPPALRAAARQQRGKTFHQYATDWLGTRSLKPRTLRGYEELLRKPLAPLHRLPLGMLTARPASLRRDAVRVPVYGLLCVLHR
jgi:hypothetical protein